MFDARPLSSTLILDTSLPNPRRLPVSMPPNRERDLPDPRLILLGGREKRQLKRAQGEDYPETLSEVPGELSTTHQPSDPVTNTDHASF